MASKQPKIKKVDYGIYEADISRKRTALEQKTTNKSMQAASKAVAYKDAAVQNMNEGLGLLTEYLNRRVETQRRANQIYGSLDDDVENLRQSAKAGAQALVAGFLSGYGGGK